MLHLDGEWEIAFDPDNQGRGQQWHQPDTFGVGAEVECSDVPACWETVRQDYEGVAWYRKVFDGPEATEGKSVRLCFDAVNYLAEVWLNGSPVGSHEGGFTGFELEVGDVIQPTGNVLIVRVLGPIVAQDLVIDGLGRNDAPHWRGAIAGGIWQPVRLQVSSATYISDLFVKPDIHTMAAGVELSIDHGGNTAATTTVDVNGQSFAAILQPGKNHLASELPMADAELWTPDSPTLHTVTATIDTDSASARFGMREFSVRDKRFTLNDQAIYLKAAFHEGLYPHTLAWPTPDLVKRELRLAKDAGFNMIRPWRKPPPPFVYDLADEMGIMFVGGLPVECMIYWPATGPHMGRRIEIEVRESILRDRNHACIVQWELFNEIHRPELKRLKRPMMILARELDPTRMIVDESGGFTGASVALPGSREATSYNEVHTYPGAPLDEASYQRLTKIGCDPDVPLSNNGSHVNDALIYVSEIGYGSPPELESNCAEFERRANSSCLTPAYRYHHDIRDGFKRDLADAGFSHLFPDIDDFCRKQQEIHADGNSRMLEAVRLNPAIAGFCLHAYTDGDWVLGAGLLDLFRNPKKAYHAVCLSNRPQYLAVHTKSTIWAGDQASITVSLVNEGPPLSGKVVLEISPSSEVVTLGAHASTGATRLVTTAFAPPAAGSYTIAARFVTDNGELVAENATSLLALAPIACTATAMLAGLPKHVAQVLSDHGVTCLPPDDLSPGVPLLVGPAPKNPEQILAFAEQGGTVVCLQLPWGTDFPGGGLKRHVETPWLPHRLTVRPAKGLWTCVPHIIRQHPISQGLPADRIMDASYEGVYPLRTILGLPGQPIVGSISYCWGGGEPDRHYLGPKGNFRGTDLGVIPHGRGRFVLSTLRIVEGLQKNAMAQALLLNLLNYLKD